MSSENFSGFAMAQEYDMYAAVLNLGEHVTRLAETQEQLLEDQSATVAAHLAMTNRWLGNIAQILLTAELHRVLAIDESRRVVTSPETPEA